MNARPNNDTTEISISLKDISRTTKMPVVSLIGKKLDLLTHKYRPTSGAGFKCHPDQAARFKQWVQDFMNYSQQASTVSPNHSDYYDSSSNSCDAAIQQVVNKCVLLTGPPGVGKTSLVYSVAEELKLHVVESHASEKRDAKLFTVLKLANQKGKINPIAKLFQAAAAQQDKASGPGSGRRKRRKLSEPDGSVVPKESQCLSLSGDTSIVLFDDIDVVFDEDGPFLKSLVEFIRESKRPVVVTATQSIDQIKNILVQFEHIHLDKPSVVDCGNLLKDICKRENYNKLSKSTRCHTIARQLDCDIRQCLNRIHFYGDTADKIAPPYSNSEPFLSDIARLDFTNIESNKSILNSFTTSSLLDIMDSRFNLTDKLTLKEHWLDGRPSVRHENPGFDHNLGEQIQAAILELSKNICSNQAITKEDSLDHERKISKVRDEFLNVSQVINEKIKSRIEPPEKEFFVDIIPSFSEIVNLEAEKRACQPNGLSSRRSRRLLSYLDSITIYLDPAELQSISYIHNYNEIE